MYMQLCAYHGTSKTHISSIKKNGLNQSKGKKQWLGDGWYFFETAYMSNGLKEAKNWVIKVKKEPEWAIFKVDIKSDNFIDLIDSAEHKGLFAKVREQAYKLHAASRRANKRFREQVIYLQLRKYITADFIRVMVNADNYGKYDYHSYTVIHPQVQICVIEKNCMGKPKLYDYKGK